MELKQMFKVLRRWWWLLATPVVVVALYLVATYRPPPTPYRVVMRFAAGGEPAAELSPDYDRHYAWLTSEYIARGLAKVAETGVFAQAVAERLAEQGVDVAPALVQAAIVSDYAESVVILYLTGPDPDRLVAMADAVSAELTDNGPRYFPQMQGLGPVARRLDDPVPVPLPPSLRAQLVGPGLRLLLAVGVGVGLAFLAHYLDPTVRERPDVEAAGVPVLASIPKRRTGLPR